MIACFFYRPSRYQIAGVDVFPAAQQVCHLSDEYYDRQEAVSEYVRTTNVYPEVARRQRSLFRDGLVNPTAAELSGGIPSPPPSNGSSVSVSSSSGSSFFQYPRVPFVHRPTVDLTGQDESQQEASTTSTTSSDDIVLVTSRRRTGISGQSQEPMASQRPQPREQPRRVASLQGPPSVAAASNSQSVVAAVESSTSSESSSGRVRDARHRSNSNGGRSRGGRGRGRRNRPRRIGAFIGNEDGEQALVWILEAAQRRGWDQSLARGMRGTFFNSVLDGLFSSDANGPLASYKSFKLSQLEKKFRDAQSYCYKKYYGQGSHSTDATGAAEETIPRYASLFREFFYWNENQERQNQAAEAARRERRSVERSLTGQMAPIGGDESGQPQTMRTEQSSNSEANRFSVSRNPGANIDVQIVRVDSAGQTTSHSSRRGRTHMTQGASTQGQQGRHAAQAPRVETRVVSRRNIENVMRESNLLGSRSQEIRHEFSSALTTLNNAMLQFQQAPIRPFGAILVDIRNVEFRLREAERSGLTDEVIFEEGYLATLRAEAQAFRRAQEQREALVRQANENNNNGRNESSNNRRNESSNDGRNDESKDKS